MNDNKKKSGFVWAVIFLVILEIISKLYFLVTFVVGMLMLFAVFMGGPVSGVITTSILISLLLIVVTLVVYIIYVIKLFKLSNDLLVWTNIIFVFSSFLSLYTIFTIRKDYIIDVITIILLFIIWWLFSRHLKKRYFSSLNAQS